MNLFSPLPYFRFFSFKTIYRCNRAKSLKPLELMWRWEIKVNRQTPSFFTFCLSRYFTIESIHSPAFPKHLIRGVSIPPSVTIFIL